jgi:hypothetical protein
MPRSQSCQWVCGGVMPTPFRPLIHQTVGIVLGAYASLGMTSTPGRGGSSYE